MQTIGKMEDGRVVAVLSFLENDILAMIGAMIELQGLEKACAQPPPPAAKIRPIRPISPNASAAGIPAKAHPWRAAIAAEVKVAAATKTTEAGKPICRTCGKPITRKNGSFGTTPKCCSPACLKEFKRIYARDAWRAKHGKKIVEAASSRLPKTRLEAASTKPADSLLTDEQRKEMEERRLKLIGISARLHADE